MRILTPIDFSGPSNTALTEAVAWSEQFGGDVVLLHVIPPSNWHVLGEAKLRADLRKAAMDRLRAEFRDIDPANQGECLVVEGVPYKEIVRNAAKRAAEMIAISPRGRSGIQQFFLGSTTERVVRTASCSVLVVRRPPKAAGDSDALSHGPRGFRRILVATGFSGNEDHAFATTVRLAELGGAEILFMHALDDADYSSYQVMSREKWERVRQAAERELLQLQRNWCGESMPSRTLLVEGVPSQSINAAARDHQVDLIVVGPRGGEGHLLGATAERVVRGAPCSVLVARQLVPQSSTE